MHIALFEKNGYPKLVVVKHCAGASEVGASPQGPNMMFTQRVSSGEKQHLHEKCFYEGVFRVFGLSQKRKNDAVKKCQKIHTTKTLEFQPPRT